MKRITTSRVISLFTEITDDMEIREKAEWSTFPFVVYDLISHGRISVDDDDKVYLDDSVLPENGLQL